MEGRWLLVAFLFAIGFFGFKSQKKFKWATKLFLIGAASGLSVKNNGIIDTAGATIAVGFVWSLVGLIVDVIIAMIRKRKTNSIIAQESTLQQANHDTPVQINSGDQFDLEKAISVAKKNRTT